MLRLEGALAATQINYRLWRENGSRVGGQERAGLGQGGSEGEGAGRQHPKVSEGPGMGGRLLPGQPGQSSIRLGSG